MRQQTVYKTSPIIAEPSNYETSKRCNLCYVFKLTQMDANPQENLFQTMGLSDTRNQSLKIHDTNFVDYLLLQEQIFLGNLSKFFLEES